MWKKGLSKSELSSHGTFNDNEWMIVIINPTQIVGMRLMIDNYDNDDSIFRNSSINVGLKTWLEDRNQRSY